MKEARTTIKTTIGLKPKLNIKKEHES